MELRPIRTAHDYEAACKRVEELWGSPQGTPSGDELDLWVELVAAYEVQHFSFGTPRPGEMILQRLQDLEMRFEDLAKQLGISPKLLQDLVHHKRPFSDAWVAKLVEVLGIPEHIFSHEYRVQPAPPKAKAKGKRVA
jgi:HTH-type transcriptional regulator/antitoxin HigA